MDYSTKSVDNVLRNLKYIKATNFLIKSVFQIAFIFDKYNIKPVIIDEFYDNIEFDVFCLKMSLSISCHTDQNIISISNKKNLETKILDPIDMLHDIIKDSK